MRTKNSNVNNLIPWLKLQKQKLFSQLIYPGFKLSFKGISDWFLFSLFIIPTYFGVRLAFFDLTAFRFFEVLLLLCIWQNKKRRKQFIQLILKSRHTVFIILYMFVIMYTNILHPSLGTIFYWLMNGVFAFYLVAYLIVEEYGIERFIEKIRQYAYILILLSPFELLTHKSLFVFLDTLHKAGGQKERFGAVRLLGNYTTTNGYAMFLCILVPLFCYDLEKKRTDIVKNAFLLILITLEIFLTGSRLNVGIVILELGLCFIIQNRRTVSKFLVIMMIVLPVLAVGAYIFRNVSFVQSLLRTFFSAFDEVFNTNYSVNFGADATILYNSSRYRELLFQKTILDTWLNPWLGRGGNYYFHVYTEGYNIQSVDNFYVGQYITYAWPGLITWLMMTVSFAWRALKRWIESKNQISWLLLVSIIGYYISLWYLDQLQTYPIMFVIFSMIYAMELLNGSQKNKLKTK